MADNTVDSFTDNPLVQALGSHLGVDALFGGSGTGGGFGFNGGGPPPPQGPQPVKPATVRPPAPRVEGSETPREFRQHAPEARAASAGRGLGPGGQPAGMNLPGVMSSDVLMHPVVQQLLKGYGVDPTEAAQRADPNLFIPHDSSFSEHHHKLAAILEGAMEGGAFTKGSSTPGEGISNVLQGFLASKQARADKYNNQLMMPFAQAQQVQNLQAGKVDQDFKTRQMQHYQDLEDHYVAMDDNRKQLTDIKSQQAGDQDEIKRLGMVQKYQHDASNIGFNDDERQQWEAVWSGSGNDPSKVDSEKLGNILATAQERHKNDLEAGRNARAKWMYKGRVDAASIGAGAKDSTKSNTMEKDVYDAMVKSKADFVKNLNNPNNIYATGPDGTKYRPGKPETKAFLAQWDQQIAEQAKKWQQDQAMATPGLMSPTTPNSTSAKPKLTYHPDGSIR